MKKLWTPNRNEYSCILKLVLFVNLYKLYLEGLLVGNWFKCLENLKLFEKCGWITCWISGIISYYIPQTLFAKAFIIVRYFRHLRDCFSQNFTQLNRILAKMLSFLSDWRHRTGFSLQILSRNSRENIWELP